MSRFWICLPIAAIGCSEYNIKPPPPEEETTPTAPTTPDDEPPPPPEPDAPVAECGVNPNPVQAIHETATWYGSNSYDPDDRPLTYSWQLVQSPPGSNPSMPGADPSEPNRPGFVADVVGMYVAELTVTNDQGVSSEPCQAQLEAIPANELWVEMYWADAPDDMDLHLVRAGGNLNTNQDCHWANRCVNGGLEWGPNGSEGDPHLDLDDIPGTGPENINISGPEDVEYWVWVHDYPGGRSQGNDVTVNIYLSGALAFSETRTISGNNDEELFALIDWRAQTVTSQ